MILATHAVVGGAVASLFPSHPVIAFFAGFFSHFLLDAIPHWQYKIVSAYADLDLAVSKNAIESGASGRIKADKYFVWDLLRIGADVFLGILITFLVWCPAGALQLEILSLGIIGGMLPDFLQFVYTRFPHQPMVLIQKFHDFMHAEHDLDGNKPFVGILLQVMFMACVVLLVKYLIRF